MEEGERGVGAHTVSALEAKSTQLHDDVDDAHDREKKDISTYEAYRKNRNCAGLNAQELLRIMELEFHAHVFHVHSICKACADGAACRCPKSFSLIET